MTAEPDPFYEATRRQRAALTAAVDAAVEMRDRAGRMPDADSIAMRELSEQASYAGAWGNDPIGHAQMVGSLLLTAGEDNVQALLRLTAEDPAPMFAHNVVARAALECLGRSVWLMEPGIGTRRRVARTRNEEFYDLEQRGLLEGLTDPDELRRRRRAILDTGKALGFERHHPDAPWLIDRRPGSTEIVEYVFTAHGVVEGFGELAYRYYSMVHHGTISGLLASLEPVDGAHDLAPPQAQLQVSAQNVSTALAAATVAYVRAVETYGAYFGYESSDWTAALAEIQAEVAARLRVLEQGP